MRLEGVHHGGPLSSIVFHALYMNATRDGSSTLTHLQFLAAVAALSQHLGMDVGRLVAEMGPRESPEPPPKPGLSVFSVLAASGMRTLASSPLVPSSLRMYGLTASSESHSSTAAPKSQLSSGPMTTAAATDQLQVVVSYNQKGPVTPVQVAALGKLGINKGLTMRTLPIAGALATPAEIRALSHNKDADYHRAIPFSGKGVGVLLNDSGIDATHMDVAYGAHVVQNTQGVTNLASLSSSLLPITYIEGAPWVISVGASEKNGILTSFSSRGKRGDGGDFVMPDGVKWSYVNQPTIVAPGVDIHPRHHRCAAAAGRPAGRRNARSGLPAVLYGDERHVDGDPARRRRRRADVRSQSNLTPANVADIIKRTATNMTGRLAWEAGAGHINAYTPPSRRRPAFAPASAQTVNSLKTFNSNELLVPGPADVPFSVDFAPVGTVGEQTFEVGKDTAWVSARATIDANSLALVLIDPDGVRYGSAIALPVLGDTVTTGAAAKPGTWSITVRGIGSLSGTNVDPAGVTNGYAAPGTMTGSVSFLNSGGYTGLSDIANHAAAPAIQYAVANRLVDGDANGQFRPDQVLRRSELAQYLLMGTSVRSPCVPFSGKSSFADLASSDAAATRAFAPSRRLPSCAYLHWRRRRDADGTGSLRARRRRARAGRIPGAAAVAAARVRGYVQLALDQGELLARFAEVKGPYDEAPTRMSSSRPAASIQAASACKRASLRKVYQPHAARYPPAVNQPVRPVKCDARPAGRSASPLA
ncbi:MAG: hypothetical protein WDW36_008021 [Sanguina aurantia]